MIIEISQLAIICIICLAIGAISGILISNFNRCYAWVGKDRNDYP